MIRRQVKPSFVLLMYLPMVIAITASGLFLSCGSLCDKVKMVLEEHINNTLGVQQELTFKF